MGGNPGGDPTAGPPSGSKVRELLAFDLALLGWEAEARRSGAPSLFSPDSGREVDPQRRTLVGFDEAGRGALAGPVVVGCVAISAEHLGDASRIEALLGGVDDSKKLTPKAREVAFAGVVSCARWAVGCASASEIDCVGIVAAAERAAFRAYRRLGASCDLAVFDRGLSLGVYVPLDLEVLQESGTRQQGAPDPEEFGGRMFRPNSQATRQQGSPDPEEFGGRMFRPNSQATRQQGSPSRHPPGVAFTRGDMRSLHVAAASIVAKVTRDHLMERLDLAFPGFELSRHKGYGTEAHRRAILRLGPSPIHRRTFLHFTEGAKSQSC